MIELTRNLYRALLDAIAAAAALLQVDESRPLPKIDPEVAGVSLEADHLGGGDDVDVRCLSTSISFGSVRELKSRTPPV